MQTSLVPRAIAAATATAASAGLCVDDAVVLHASNKITLRLLPCDVVARVAPPPEDAGRFELELARQLGTAGCPVAGPDPRVPPQVYQRDGFMITFWAYHRPTSSADPSPADYAAALVRLHAGMRTVDTPTPHFTDRVASALELTGDPGRTPELPDADRSLLDDTLRRLGRSISERSRDQLLHGEPHPGNVISTDHGLVFVDLETCCRGPVEFDLAHAPDEVAAHYPGLDQDLLRDCRTLKLAMIITWRWDREDRLPDGRRLADEWMSELRADLAASGDRSAR